MRILQANGNCPPRAHPLLLNYAAETRIRFQNVHSSLSQADSPEGKLHHFVHIPKCEDGSLLKVWTELASWSVLIYRVKDEEVDRKGGEL